MNLPKLRSELDRRFLKISQTAPGFDFFVAIHDFVDHIESQKFLSRRVSLPGKYRYLKDIYQGLEDKKPTLVNTDLGHARCMAVLDLNRIQKKEVSSNNMFWRKREFFRKAAKEIHSALDDYISEKEKTRK